MIDATIARRIVELMNEALELDPVAVNARCGIDSCLVVVAIVDKETKQVLQFEVLEGRLSPNVRREKK